VTPAACEILIGLVQGNRAAVLGFYEERVVHGYKVYDRTLPGASKRRSNDHGAYVSFHAVRDDHRTWPGISENIPKSFIEYVCFALHLVDARDTPPDAAFLDLLRAASSRHHFGSVSSCSDRYDF